MRSLILIIALAMVACATTKTKPSEDVPCPGEFVWGVTAFGECPQVNPKEGAR